MKGQPPMDQLDVNARERQFLEYHLLIVVVGPLRLQYSRFGMARRALHRMRQFMGKDIAGRNRSEIAMVVEKALNPVFVNRNLGSRRTHQPGGCERAGSSRFRGLFQRTDSKGARAVCQFSRVPVYANPDLFEY